MFCVEGPKGKLCSKKGGLKEFAPQEQEIVQNSFVNDAGYIELNVRLRYVCTRYHHPYSTPRGEDRGVG